jgi:hypothetical protein
MAKGIEWTMLALAYLRVCGQVPKDQQAQELDWVMTGLGECEGLDESGSGTTRIDNIANVAGVEDHDAFSVRFLDEVAQHGDTPDYSVVSVEIKNNLSVVSKQSWIPEGMADPQQPVNVSGISSGWQGSTTDGIFFEGKSFVLQPGINIIKLTCRVRTSSRRVLTPDAGAWYIYTTRNGIGDWQRCFRL